MKAGWVKHSLKDVTTKIGSGATPLGGETVYKGTGISLIRSLNVHDAGFRTKDLALIDDLQATRLSNVVVESGDVLLNITGASIARCCVVPDEVLPARVNQHVSILRPVKGRIKSKLLQYLLTSKSYKDRLLASGEGAGATRQALTKAQLQEFCISFPEAIQEQQRIVAILDEAFDGIATAKTNAEKNLQNAREVFESHLQSVFTLRGKDWVETILERLLVDQPRNGWSPPAENHSDSGTPVLTLSSVTGFQFRADKIKFTSARAEPHRHYWVNNGDFLITRSNTPELVGHVAIAAGLTERTIYPDLIMRMTPALDRILTKFLYYQMRTPFLRLEITGRAQGANPTMKKISKGSVQSLPIAVPPIHKQKEIVDQLDSLHEESQHLESIYRQKLTTLDDLKQSLLHRAFNGDL